jgi:hypothetical protein
MSFVRPRPDFDPVPIFVQAQRRRFRKGLFMSEVATISPHQFATLLRRPAFCVGEDFTEFDRLRDDLVEEIKPVTCAEYLLVNDIIVAEWELLRLHGFKAGMLNAHTLAALKDHGSRWRRDLHQNDPLPTLLRLMRDSAAGNPEARKKLEQRLKKYQLTLQDLATAAFEQKIAAQIQTDRLINATLQRRETAYREIERRRSSRNQSVIDAPKRIAAAIIDGEIALGEQRNDAASDSTTSVMPFGDAGR